MNEADILLLLLRGLIILFFFRRKITVNKHTKQEQHDDEKHDAGLRARLQIATMETKVVRDIRSRKSGRHKRNNDLTTELPSSVFLVANILVSKFPLLICLTYCVVLTLVA